MFIQFTASLFPVFLNSMLLVFGQESNDLPEGAASSRICQGSNMGFSLSGSSQDQYDFYRQRYTNCKYVDGNLEITYLDGTGNWDLSFLESIEEKQGLMELGFKNLQEIMNGTVYINNNNLLCYASTIRWEDINPTVTRHVRMSIDSSVYNRRCGECHGSCYNENTGSRHCWGEGPEMCQILNHGPACSQTCTDRCFGTDPSQCCHPQCAAGCRGPKSTDCYACKSLVNDGECVSSCPADKVYNQQNELEIQENVEGKYCMVHFVWTTVHHNC
ncbi:unnamed protein product [Mytilus coruscus]|uniref:receptor protein-tyrosine kinase n=1 Tax=Mytilus coruscus TaxID=42192 RepID=A0A6J8CXV7_MYTCO|nr:unnamed protein product [Mytilus coruscus]